MQLGGKLARGRTPTDHQEGQQATAFIVRDGGNGCLFKGINNVGANGPRVFQLFEKVNGIARFLSFGDGCDPATGLLPGKQVFLSLSEVSLAISDGDGIRATSTFFKLQSHTNGFRIQVSA